MISVQPTPRPGRWRRRRRVFAVFSYRYDAHLVSDLIANVGPMTDGWVAFDDTGSGELFSDEVERRVALLRAAREAGADWALAVDPDERYETRLAAKIDRLMRTDGPIAYTFRLREMYGPDRYRVDGLWGRKRQPRLLSLSHGVIWPEGRLHLPWSACLPEARVFDTPFNLYHLKMIDRRRRAARVALYNHLDPKSEMQAFGYDYLAEDEGASFERIPRGRAYLPVHREDGGLWMPDVEKTDLHPR